MQVLPKDVIGILWLDVGLYGKVCGAFQSLGIAIFMQFYSTFNDGDKAEQGHSAPSMGIPWSAQVSPVFTIRVLHMLENGLGRGKSISTALVCDSMCQLCSQPGFIPAPHILIPVLGMEGTAQHRSVPQGDSHPSLQPSCTALSTLWDGLGCLSASSLEM